MFSAFPSVGRSHAAVITDRRCWHLSYHPVVSIHDDFHAGTEFMEKLKDGVQHVADKVKHGIDDATVQMGLNSEGPQKQEQLAQGTQVGHL